MSINPATLWGEIIADELIRAGLRHVVISPGSRSTPLTLAFSRRPALRRWLQIDERSAAFFALGLAQAAGEPVALICTSGTAAAEYFPAIIEARHSAVPLLILTADRPPELRDSGANQTIDQGKLYGQQMRWQIELPLPEAAPAPRTLRALRATLGRALAQAAGWADTPPGPVHINLPFRKPLQPHDPAELKEAAARAAAGGRAAARPWTQFYASSRHADPAAVETLAALLNKARRAVIVAGPRCPRSGDFAAAVSALTRALGAPLLADPLSNLRFGLAESLGAYEWTLEALPAPDLVLRLGAMPTSSALLRWLAALPADVPQIGIQRFGLWQDGGFTLSHFLAADETALLRAVEPRLRPQPDPRWLAAWQRAEAIAHRQLDALPAESEGGLVRALLRQLPPETRLFLANSLPVRHVDAFAPPGLPHLHVFGNRGVSGIDGTLSSALGMAAAAPDAPALLLTGDLSFLHDVNGLMLLKRYALKLDIVLIDNNGGGIFHRLPIAHHEPPFNEWFITPHGLDLAAIARAYGLNVQERPPAAAAAALQSALRAPEAQLIRVRTDSAASEAIRRAVKNDILQSIKEAL